MTVQPHRAVLCSAALLACTLLPGSAAAQEFSALVSPPRFEDKVKAGSTYRNVIEITNVSGKAAHFSVKTADWTFKPDATVQFFDALAPGSCRPWVGVEATDITLAPSSKRRYRFEVAVPADAPSGECRFAIMIEGDPQTVKSGMNVPVSGRIGVVVYLLIGDAAARLEIVGHKVATIEGRVLPVLSLRNTGTAHGRVLGFVDGKDAGGRKFAFMPSTLPILPGETRDIALTPQGDDDDTPAPALAYPLQLKGRLDADKQQFDIDTTFDR